MTIFLKTYKRCTFNNNFIKYSQIRLDVNVKQQKENVFYFVLLNFTFFDNNTSILLTFKHNASTTLKAVGCTQKLSHE